MLVVRRLGGLWTEAKSASRVLSEKPFRKLHVQKDFETFLVVFLTWSRTLKQAGTSLVLVRRTFFSKG